MNVLRSPEKEEFTRIAQPTWIEERETDARQRKG